MKSPIRKHRSPEQWQALVHQWRQSGRSASEFCKAHDLGYVSFCHWRKRLSQGNGAQTMATPEPDQGSGFIDLGAVLSTEPLRASVERRLSLNLNLGSWLNLSIQF